MNFNPDPCKQAQELQFIPKTSFKLYPSLSFIDNLEPRKYLSLFLDPKLSLDQHSQCILNKTRKINGLTRKLQPVILRKTY